MALKLGQIAADDDFMGSDYSGIFLNPDDVAGLAVSYTRFGDAFRNRPGPIGIAAEEMTLELTYKAQVKCWLSMQADGQLLFAPAVNPSSNSRQTVVVIGMLAQVSF